MANYYDLLQIMPHASRAEVDSAYESQYDTLRRLVNHPTQGLSVQNKLAQLEEARQVLTDPVKRAAYDAQLGGASELSGLADPSAAAPPVMPAMAPPPVSVQLPQAPPQQAAGTRAGIWSCPGCSLDNPPNTRFCFNCGTQLVRECPECQRNTSLVASGFCGECGIHWDAAMRRRTLEQEQGRLAAELNSVRAELQATGAALGPEIAGAQDAANRAEAERAEVVSSLAGYSIVALMSGFALTVLALAVVNRQGGALAWVLTIASFGILVWSVVTRQSKSRLATGLAVNQRLAGERVAQLTEQREIEILDRIAALNASADKVRAEFEELGRRPGQTGSAAG
jgi:hypothetical protein